MIELLPLAARGVTAQSAELTMVPNWEIVESAMFFLDVTAAGVGVGDTLNLRLQQIFDAGDGSIRAFDDFVSFTQVLGNGGVKQFMASWRRDLLPATPMRPPVADTLAAGSVLQGPITKRIRASWVVAGAGPPSFTFRLLAHLVQRRVA